MITFEICLALGLALSALVIWMNVDDYNDFWSNLFIGGILFVFIMAMSFLVGVVVTMFVGDMLPSKTVRTDEHGLVAMEDQNGLHGDFFLGTGSIGSEWKFAYYEKGDDGSVKLKVVDVEDAKIFEDGGDDPRVVVYKKELANKDLKRWGVLGESHYSYEFHIPQGSITNQFKLDLDK